MLPVGDLFQSYRPDIAKLKHCIYVLELTVCHETNMINSPDYKKNKYKDIGRYGSTGQAIGRLFPISLKFLLWVSLLIYRILLRL